MGQEREQNNPRGLTRREFLRRAGAVALGTAAGLILPDALKNKAQADASVGEVQYRHKVLIPQVTKEYKENPYLTREFGAPERGVIMRNRVEQGGRNPAYVEMGDQELFENMMYLRERWGRPDLNTEVTFYSSWDIMDRTPGIPAYNPADRSTFGLVPWESYAGNNGTFRAGGGVLFRYREADKTIERHIVLPEVLPGKIPTKRELELVTVQFLDTMRRMFWTNEDRTTTIPIIRPGDPVGEDLDSHPLFVSENGELQKAALWIRMEAIPTSGGK